MDESLVDEPLPSSSVIVAGTMLKKLTELFDEDAMAAWSRAASERSAIVV